MIERLTAIVDAEIGKFKRKMGEVKALARSIPNRITVTVKENFKEAERRMGVFESRMARLSRVINDFQTVFGNAFSGMKMSIFPALVPVIASLTAALGSLGPVIGVASGGLMGLASSFGTAAAGAGAFGALAISNISGVFKASSDLAKLQQKLDETTDLKERANGKDQSDSGKPWCRGTESTRHLGGLQSKLARDSPRNTKADLEDVHKLFE